MAEMRLKASGSELKIISAIHLTSTQAQYDTCLFEFDGAWDGYSLRTAVFYSNPNNIKPMLLDEDNKCFIPWDSFSNSRYLYIGVYGSNGNSYLPTQFVEIMYQPGANIDDHNYPPTPGIYEQIITFMEEHAHGSITRDGKIGTVANRFLVTGSGGAVGVKTPQQVVDLVGVSNPNILHNWDWRNPINQRGNMSCEVPSSGKYFIDRWLFGTQGGMKTAHIKNGYMEFPHGSYMQHRVEGLFLKGKEITFSVRHLGGGISKVTTTVPVSGEKNASFSGVGVLWCGVMAAGNIYFKVVFYDLREIEAVKLELGPISTLHLDPPMDHAVELPKCQRFYQKYKGTIRFRATEIVQNEMNCFFSFLYKMRVSPTISNIVGLVRTISGSTQSGFTFEVNGSYPDGFLLRVNKTSHGLTDAAIIITDYEASADL